MKVKMPSNGKHSNLNEDEMKELRRLLLKLENSKTKDIPIYNEVEKDQKEEVYPIIAGELNLFGLSSRNSFFF